MVLNALIANAHLLGTAVTTCIGGGNACDTGLPIVSASNGALQTILQILFAVLAAVAVLFVVIGGLRYVFSQGSPEGTAKARSTIIYALVGLIIAVSAEALVSFVLGRT